MLMNAKMTYTRGAAQFGNALPRKLQINAGIGPQLYADENTHYGVVEPTVTFKTTLELKIGDFEAILFHAPGETDDQICIYIEQAKMVIAADNIYPAFPNLYAIRGVPARDTSVWANTLQNIANYLRRAGTAAVLVGMHCPPLTEDALRTTLVYSDAIQFVHDQTVRLMNAGMKPHEIVKNVKKIYPFGNERYLREQYGTIEQGRL